LTSSRDLIIFPGFFERKGKEMSVHSSLKSSSKIATKRNVLKRFERVDLMRSRGKWKDGDRAFGLPKTKQ
jgi:small basic protein (TIGR04137 family)